MNYNHYKNGWVTAVFFLLISSSLFSQFTFECPPDALSRSNEQPIQFIDGQSGSSSVTFAENDCISSIPGIPYYYSTISVSVDEEDDYFIEIDGLSESDILAIYFAGFDIGFPCLDLIANARFLKASDGVASFSNDHPTKRLFAHLSDGESYTLLLATTIPAIDYHLSIYSLDGGAFSNIPLTQGNVVTHFIQADVDDYFLPQPLSYNWNNDGSIVDGSISNMDYFNILSSTGLPVLSGGCDNNTMSCYDEYVDPSDCDDHFIIRHFSFTVCDGAAQDTCSQTIKFSLVTIEDVILPNKTVYLNCADIPLFDGNNQPHPSITGYPFVFTNNKMHPIANSVNNVGASYSDDTSFPGVVIRHWSIIDWCIPTNIIQFFQYIHLDAQNEVTLECLAPQSNATKNVQVNSIAIPPLIAGSPLPPEDLNCLPGNDGDYRYNTFSFTVEEEGQFVFETRGLSENGVVALYENAFGTTGNCDDLLQIGHTLPPGVGFYSGLSEPISRVSLTCQPGITYTLMVADTDYFDVEAVAYSPSGSLLNSISSQSATIQSEIICGDEGVLLFSAPLSFQVDHDGTVVSGSIASSDLEKLQLTGIPNITTSFGISAVTLTDSLVHNNCGDGQIIRHFEILVNANNQCNYESESFSCDQVINIRLPNEGDVIAPPLHTTFRCIDDINLDDQGLPIAEDWEYPYLVTTSGWKRLSPGLCQYTADYTTETLSPTSWHRRWTVTDTCSQEIVLNFEQNIQLTPDPELTIECPDDQSQVAVETKVQFLSLSIINGFQAVDFSSANCLEAEFQDTYLTNLKTLTVDQSDFYTFEVSGLPADGFAGIYKDAFNPDAPCQSILAVAKPILPATGYFGTSSTVQRFGVWLEANAAYYLLVAAQSSADVSVAVYSEHEGSLNNTPEETANIVYDLRTWDIPYLSFSAPQIYYVDNLGNDIGTPLPSEAKAILDKTGYPQISGEYGNYRVTIHDEMLPEEECNDFIIRRTFEVQLVPIDACEENTAITSCEQLLHFGQPHIQDIFWPDMTPSVSCDAPFETNAVGLPSINETGHPFFTSAFRKIEINETYSGNILLNTLDLDVTEDSFRRQWSVVNECSLMENDFVNQFVSIENQNPPVLSCQETEHPSGIVHYPLNSDDCKANIFIPFPETAAICPSFNQIDMEITHLLDDNTEEIIAVQTGAEGITADSLLPGYYHLYYTAIDAENDTSYLDCPFIVQEMTPPTVVVNSDLNAYMGGGGIARIYAEDVDDGSYDNCSEVDLLVRKAGSSIWQNYVEFDCSDVGTEITIELLVWDDGNASGEFGDTVLKTYSNGYSELVSDNFATGQVTVLIGDLIRPTCIAPHDLTLLCDDWRLGNIDNWDEEYANQNFGTASISDNCGGVAYQTLILSGLNDCGYGNITRVFRAEDNWGLTSINTCRQVIHVQAVHDYTIYFPRDNTIHCGELIAGEAEYWSEGCDNIVISYEDHLTGDCTMKRTYSVINTCVYDGISPAIVIGRDEDCNQMPGDESVYVIVKPTTSGSWVSHTTYIDADNNPFNNIPAVMTNRCDSSIPAESGGHWANSTLSPELEDVGFYQYTQIYHFVETTPPVISHSELSGVLCTGDNPCGAATLPSFTVSSDCPLDSSDIHVYFDQGNDGSIDGEALFFDMNIQDDGTIEVVYIPGVAVGDEYLVTISATNSCGDEGTFSFLTEVSSCSDTYLGGNIQTVSGLPLEGAEVIASGENTFTTTTDEEGDYQFCTLAGMNSFSLMPYLNTNIQAGLSTLDIILMSKHILGIQPITNPYYLIAADVNNSGSISTFDMILLRRVILGLSDSFPDNNSWRFVDSEYAFGANPLEENFPEFLSFTNFDLQLTGINFIAIKIGDVNGSVMPLQGEIIEDRTDSNPVYLQISNQRVQAGEVFSISARIGTPIIGVQGTLLFDANALTMTGNRLPSYLNTEHKGQGILPFMWDIYQESGAERRVFELTFEAKKTGRISELFQLSSRVTTAEAFDEAGQKYSLELKFAERETPLSDFEVLESFPNPFAENTTIRYSLEEQESVRLIIRGASGQVIKDISLIGEQGINQLVLTKGDFPAGGVYFYSLISKNNQRTRDLVVVK